MKNNDVIYSICTTNQFRKDLKLMEKRGYNIALLDEIVDLLSKSYLLKNRDHVLKGEFQGSRECHITLIYVIENDELILYLTNTGSHSDLF